MASAPVLDLKPSLRSDFDCRAGEGGGENRLTFRCWKGKMPSWGEGASLCPPEVAGGQGLWMPDADAYTNHASTVWQHLQWP